MNDPFNNPFAPNNSRQDLPNPFAQMNPFPSFSQLSQFQPENPFQQTPPSDILQPSFIQSTAQSRPSEPRTTVCHFFNTPGGCKNGDQCPFQHTKQAPGPTTKVPCKFFLEGRCMKGDACPFFHPSETPPQNIKGFFDKHFPAKGKVWQPKQEEIEMDISEETEGYTEERNTKEPLWRLQFILPDEKARTSLVAQLKTFGKFKFHRKRSGKRLDVLFFEKGAAFKAYNKGLVYQKQKVQSEGPPKLLQLNDSTEKDTLSNSKPKLSTKSEEKSNRDAKPVKQKVQPHPILPVQTYVLTPKTPVSNEKLIGTCTEMCPREERQLREATRELHWFEVLEGTRNTELPKADPLRCVKKYSRSDAGKSLPEPEMVRPPKVLEMTMEYLLQCLDSTDIELPLIYGFLRDRFRAIRQDLKFQSEYGMISVGILEKMVRFHILMRFSLRNVSREYFDSHQNSSLLRDCIDLLDFCYTELRNRGVECPNASEMQEYKVIGSFGEGITVTEGCSVLLRGLVSSFVHSNYVRFFTLARQLPIVHRCILVAFVQEIRSKALISIYETFTQFPLDKFASILVFSSVEKAAEFVQCFGIDVGKEQMIPCKLQLKVGLGEPEGLSAVDIDFDAFDGVDCKLSDIVRSSVSTNGCASGVQLINPSKSSSSMVSIPKTEPLSSEMFEYAVPTIRTNKSEQITIGTEDLVVPVDPFAGSSNSVKPHGRFAMRENVYQSSKLSQVPVSKKFSIAPHTPELPDTSSIGKFSISPLIENPPVPQEKPMSLSATRKSLLEEKVKTFALKVKQQSTHHTLSHLKSLIASKHSLLDQKKRQFSQHRHRIQLASTICTLLNLTKDFHATLSTLKRHFILRHILSRWRRASQLFHSLKSIEKGLENALQNANRLSLPTNPPLSIQNGITLSRIAETVAPHLIPKNTTHLLFSVAVSTQSTLNGSGNWLRNALMFCKVSRSIEWAGEIEITVRNQQKILRLCLAQTFELIKGVQGVLFVSSRDSYSDSLRFKSFLAQLYDRNVPIAVLTDDPSQFTGYKCIPLTDSVTNSYNSDGIIDAFHYFAVSCEKTPILHHIRLIPTLKRIAASHIPITSAHETQCVLDAFNHTLEKAIALLTDEKLMKCNTPSSISPFESIPVHWNSEYRLECIKNALRKARIPHFDSSVLSGSAINSAAISNSEMNSTANDNSEMNSTTFNNSEIAPSGNAISTISNSRIERPQNSLGFVLNWFKLFIDSCLGNSTAPYVPSMVSSALVLDFAVSQKDLLLMAIEMVRKVILGKIEVLDRSIGGIWALDNGIESQLENAFGEKLGELIRKREAGPSNVSSGASRLFKNALEGNRKRRLDAIENGDVKRLIRYADFVDNHLEGMMVNRAD